MFASGSWDYRCFLWFPVCLLCFFTISSSLQSFHNREVLNWLAERNTVKKWKEKVYEVKVQNKTNKKRLQIRVQIWKENFFEGFEGFDLTSNDLFTMFAPPFETTKVPGALWLPSPWFLQEEGKEREWEVRLTEAKATRSPHIWQGMLCTAQGMMLIQPRPLAPCAPASLTFSQKSLLRWKEYFLTCKLNEHNHWRQKGWRRDPWGGGVLCWAQGCRAGPRATSHHSGRVLAGPGA